MINLGDFVFTCYNEEETTEVQKILFECGYEWIGNGPYRLKIMTNFFKEPDDVVYIYNYYREIDKPKKINFSYMEPRGKKYNYKEFKNFIRKFKLNKIE